MKLMRTSVASAGVAALLIVGCGSSDAKNARTTAVVPGAKDPSDWPADDHSLCKDWKSKAELEVSETVGEGSIKPNVRRIFKLIGKGDALRKVLICREADTNLDGLKDVVRMYNAKGEAIHEEADTNFDGKIDLWISFVNGHIVEMQIDNNNDGRPDEWRYFTEGKLARIKRDRNFDGRPDVWEIYVDGKLERIGVDESLDGKVDHWLRDEIAASATEESERKAETAAAADAGATAADGGKVATDAAAPSTAAAGAPDASAPVRPKKSKK